MTAHTRAHAPQGLNPMAHGIGRAGGAPSPDTAGVARGPALAAILSGIRRAARWLTAGIAAGREAQVLAEIARYDPRMVAEIRAARDRAEAQRDA